MIWRRLIENSPPASNIVGSRMRVSRVPAVPAAAYPSGQQASKTKQKFLGFCVLTVRTVLLFNQKHKSFLPWLGRLGVYI